MRSEWLLRTAGSVAHIGGWAYEIDTGEISWSDELYTITSFASDQTPTFSELLEQFSSAARARLAAAVEVCQTAGTPYDLELEFTTFDGRELWVRCVGRAERDVDGMIVRLRGAMQDITGQRSAALEIEQLAQRLSATMESITDALFTLDRDWRFTYVNARAEELLERDRQSLLGRYVWGEFPAAASTRLREAYELAVDEQTTVTVDDFYYEPLDLWIEVRAFPSPDGLTVYFRDMSQRRLAEAEREARLEAEQRAREEAQQAQQTIKHQATHDPLTGLYNRSEVIARLEAVGSAGCTVLLLDLDGFKQVNDALGHTAGDELIVEVARLLRELVRRGDLLARVGGDEFVVLLPGHEPQVVHQIAERVLDALRTPLRVAGRRLYVTASMGIARAYPGASAESALRDADVALYRAKEAGRDGSVWYDPALQQQVSQRLATAAELHDALQSEQLLLHYQPAFDLTTGAPVGAEALARWQHPERGLILPGRFIPVAEETGLIEPLGDWCLATALEIARLWRGNDEKFTIWVNVAIHQLRRPGLAARIQQSLTSTGTQPHQLGIEITESAFAQEAGQAVAELDAISKLGVQIAIDDFGTGYSSLSRLAHLPIDILKIDRSFIANLDTHSGAATVAAIIDLAHAIGVRVIAEGVETPEQLLALREAGCDHASGFFLARPGHPEKLPDACAAGTRILRMLPSGQQLDSDRAVES